MKTKTITTRKLAKTEIDFLFLANLLKGESCIWTDAPSDLRVISIFQTPENRAFGRFTVVMESESFSPVWKGGNSIPYVYFEYES